jgi:hypothetical protein
MLSGKWVWIWNWRRCLDGNPVAVAARLKDAGCCGAFVKSDDGGHAFDQGRPVWEIVQALQEEGLLAGLWGYVYGCDSPTVIYGDLKQTTTDESAIAARFITERPSPSYRGPDAYVIDVEAEYERQPSDPAAAAERYLSAIRPGAGPDFSLLFAPLPQPDYHRALPYRVFQRHCNGVMPQAYHNAMQVSPQRAIALCVRCFCRRRTPRPTDCAHRRRLRLRHARRALGLVGGRNRTWRDDALLVELRAHRERLSATLGCDCTRRPTSKGRDRHGRRNEEDARRRCLSTAPGRPHPQRRPRSR